MRRPEQEIQKTVVQHLNRRATNGVFFFHVPNGGKKSPQMGGVHKALGVIAGVPDLIILKGGECFALELKAPNGRVSETQHVARNKMNDAGARTAVAYGLDEALVILECWGVLKRSVAVASSETKQGNDNGSRA
jgi:hypothetical protein